MINNEEILDFIQLINSENVGPITFYKFLEKFGSAKNALSNLSSKYKIFPRNKAQEEIEKANRKNIQILSFKNSAYPQKLKELLDAPPILYAKGNVKLLNHPLMISVVGARSASINGRKIISKLAYDLTNEGLIVVSGMARGIDTAAHKGAMYAKEQRGETIAVLGTGVDVIYPAENAGVYEQIIKQGVVVSEFPIGTEPQGSNFPRRNRIVAGLTMGTLVGESSINSGSLITARLALEQGKDIFAIPGNPNDTRSSGPNKLIKDGAILVENAEDVIEALSFNNRQVVQEFVKSQEKNNAKIYKLDNEEKKSNIPYKISKINVEKRPLLEHITIDGTDVDDLIRDTGIEASAIAMELLELELSGKIERRIGNKVALIMKKSK